MKYTKPANHLPLILVLFGVLLRVLHLLNSMKSPTFWAPAVDPLWYDTTAMNMLSGNFGPFPLFRAPLYPISLAGVYAVFGHDLIAARVLNIAFQGAAIWLLFRLGQSYFSTAVGAIAAFLLAVNGMAIYFSAEIVSASAEILAAVFVLWATLRLQRERSFNSLALCGILWGLAAITRPNFLLLFPIPMILLFLSSETKRVKTILLWTLFAFVPVLPVTTANVIQGKEFVLVATQGGVNLWIGNNPYADGMVAELPGYGPGWTMADAQNEAENSLGRTLSAGEVSDFYSRKAFEFITSEPLQATKLFFKKTLLFFNRFEVSNNKHITYFSALSPWLPSLIWFNFAVLIPMGLLGIYALRKKSELSVMLWLIIFYALSVILFFVTARFRMPIVPWLCVLSGCGFVYLYNTLKPKLSAEKSMPLLILIPGIALAYNPFLNLRETPIGQAKFMEGNAYMKLNQLDFARDSFESAIKNSDSFPMAHLNLGVIAFRQGNLTEAKKQYEITTQLDSMNVAAYNNLGTVYESLGDTARAAELYRRSLNLRPYQSDARVNLAGIYYKMGVSALKSEDGHRAEKMLELSLQLYPTAAVYYHYALALSLSGKDDAALQSLNQSLALEPNYAPARRLKDQLIAQSSTSEAAR